MRAALTCSGADRRVGPKSMTASVQRLQLISYSSCSRWYAVWAGRSSWADHECITCMPAESNALRARGDGATASRPHLHQPTRALLVSARTASPGDAASARRRSRTRAVNGTRALRSISVVASGSAERHVPNALARVHLTAPPQVQSPQATPEHRQRSCSGGRCIVARGV